MRVCRPRLRTYLIDHPDISLDDFAAAYSTSFLIRWEYDPSHVIIASASEDKGGILINPIYEEHIRQLRNWAVGDVFRRKFPEMAEIVDSYSQSEKYVCIDHVMSNLTHRPSAFAVFPAPFNDSLPKYAV